MINRSAITIRAKQPFMDWLRGLPDPVGPEITLASVNNEPYVYLLPEYGDSDEQDELLAQFLDVIFENELKAWWIVEEDWPNPRDLALFKKWFDIQSHTIVEDLADLPLIDED